MTPPKTRREFLAQSAAVLSAPLALAAVGGEVRATEAPSPFRIDFIREPKWAALVCRTFEIIDLRTGTELLTPEGARGVWYADEATGECAAYNKPFRWWHRRTHEFINGPMHRRLDGLTETSIGLVLEADLELAWHSFNAPIQFAPRPGKEADAERLRRLAATHNALMRPDVICCI